MPKFTVEDLKKKTLEELAVIAERNNPLSAEGVLVKEELRRRENENAKTKSWHETFIGKVVVGVIVGIIVFFATAAIARYIFSKF